MTVVGASRSYARSGPFRISREAGADDYFEEGFSHWLPEDARDETAPATIASLWGLAQVAESWAPGPRICYPESGGGLTLLSHGVPAFDVTCRPPPGSRT